MWREGRSENSQGRAAQKGLWERKNDQEEIFILFALRSAVQLFRYQTKNVFNKDYIAHQFFFFFQYIQNCQLVIFLKFFIQFLKVTFRLQFYKVLAVSLGLYNTSLSLSYTQQFVPPTPHPLVAPLPPITTSLFSISGSPILFCESEQF